MAPAAAGGGWDLTARAMQATLRDEKLVSTSIEVSNVVGAGGATGLAQLLSKGKGDPHQWMVTGLVMIGAAERARNGSDLTQATPIATLTAEAEGAEVPTFLSYTYEKRRATRRGRGDEFGKGERSRASPDRMRPTTPASPACSFRC